jgi:hypothetical protein
MTRVLVTGGRDYFNPGKIREALDGLRKGRGIKLLIHGMATGADASARAWADKFGVDQCMFPANWKGRGGSAGPFRNALMLEVAQPDVVVAFPGGRGTDDMVQRATEAGVEVVRIHE